jgi:hypothetical protein
MAAIHSFVGRNFDRDEKGELTVSKFIVQAIRERFGKLDRAKRSAQSRAARKKGGVIHPPANGRSRPATSLADKGLPAGTDSPADDGQ